MFITTTIINIIITTRWSTPSSRKASRSRSSARGRRHGRSSWADWRRRPAPGDRWRCCRYEEKIIRTGRRPAESWPEWLARSHEVARAWMRMCSVLSWDTQHLERVWHWAGHVAREQHSLVQAAVRFRCRTSNADRKSVLRNFQTFARCVPGDTVIWGGKMISVLSRATNGGFQHRMESSGKLPLLTFL